MTDLKFSLTCQCHKTTILHIMFRNENNFLAWHVRLYHQVNAGSHRLQTRLKHPACSSWSDRPEV